MRGWRGRGNVRAGSRLLLPRAVIIAALEVDGESAVAGDLHRREDELAAGLNCCDDGRFGR